MRMLKTLVFLLFIFNLSAQKTDSTSIDSSKIHSPKKAALFSAIIPATGQIYNHIALAKDGKKGKNKVYWKVPAIYSTLGFGVYQIIYNQNKTSIIKEEYNKRINDENYTPPTEWENYSLEDLSILYKKKQTLRDFSILGTGLVYAIQIIDANIEAHFVSFDISPDLSLQIRPQIYSSYSAGVNFKFSFR